MTAIKTSGVNPRVLRGGLHGLPPARVTHMQLGVIGPFHRTCASINAVETSQRRTHIVWHDHTRQVIDTNQTVLEFFAPSEIDNVKIDLEWNKLTGDWGSNNSPVPAGSFVLMTGLPGSGKTTLANQLSHELGVFHFDFASFTKRIVGRHPLCQEDYIRVGMEVDKLILNYLNCGGSVIYDTTAIDGEIRTHHYDAIPRSSPRTLVRVPTDSILCHRRLVSQRPSEAPDLRPLLTRTSAMYVRTFYDFVRSYELPSSAIVVPNDRDIRDASLSIIESLGSQA